MTRGELDPYDPSRQPEPVDADLINLLRERDGVVTTVELLSGDKLEVLDIAWGYDALDDRAHVTTNVSPGRSDRSIDVFTTNEVQAVRDPETGRAIWTRNLPSR